MEFPEYLTIARERLGEGTGVAVEVVEDTTDLAYRIIDDMLESVARAAAKGRSATFIVPVGPVDHYPRLAARVNRDSIDLREVVFINMDEYLTESGDWIDPGNPLSFRGYMDRLFYDRLRPELAPRIENRVFPDPQDPGAIASLMEARGGVDMCVGGIGINGHIAFNEPPGTGVVDSQEATDAFAELPTRVLDLSCETRTINSVTVGGDISVIPSLAITVGMREILASDSIRLYCNRPWQRGVIRRVLHGPITARCPASLVRRHRDARVTATREVATPPDIRLR